MAYPHNATSTTNARRATSSTLNKDVILHDQLHVTEEQQGFPVETIPKTGGFARPLQRLKLQAIKPRAEHYRVRQH